MTSLLGARKRAEEFAAAIDPSAARPTTATPELAELVELVELMGTLRAHEQPQLRPEFRDTLRAQLVAEAERSLAEDATLTLRPRRRGARERRLALLASSFVLVGGSAGMAVAAQDALPGDALYPIKRGIENAQADLSRDEAAKGRDLLAQADSRLTEVERIVGTAADPQVTGTIDDFRSQAGQGSTLLLAAYDETQDAALVTDVRSFAREALDTLQTVAVDAPAEHQDELADAAAALLAIDEQAAAACPSCAEGRPALEMPQRFLVAEEVNRALDRASDAGRETELDNNHPPLPGTSGTTPDTPGDKQRGQREGNTGTDESTGQDSGTPDQGEDDADGGLLPDLGGKGDGKGDGGKKGDKGLLGTVDDTTKQLLPGLDPLLDSLLP